MRQQRQRGSIFKRRLASGQTVYDIKYRVAGRQVMRRGFSTKAAAQAELIRCLSSPSRSNTRFSQFADRWYRVKVEPVASEETKRVYGYVLRRHLVPLLGDARLSELRREEVENYLGTLTRSTAKLVHAVLNSILNAAVEWGELADHPMKSMRLGGPKASDARYLSPAEARILTNWYHEPLDKAIVLLAWHAGLRRGEIFGLRWEDVDFARSIIRVRRQYRRGDKPLKTLSARRVVPMSEELQKTLEAIRRDEGYVASLKGDKPLDAGYWSEKRLKPALKELGLPPVTLHALRHTCATTLLASGAPIDTVKRILGHVSISTTSDIYGHHDLAHLKDLKRFLENV